MIPREVDKLPLIINNCSICLTPPPPTFTTIHLKLKHEIKSRISLSYPFPPLPFPSFLSLFHLQVCAVLQQVCRKESLVLPPELAKRIAEKSGRNLRKALLLCEACRVQQ